MSPETMAPDRATPMRAHASVCRSDPEANRPVAQPVGLLCQLELCMTVNFVVLCTLEYQGRHNRLGPVIGLTMWKSILDGPRLCRRHHARHLRHQRQQGCTISEPTTTFNDRVHRINLFQRTLPEVLRSVPLASGSLTHEDSWTRGSRFQATRTTLMDPAVAHARRVEESVTTPPRTYMVVSTRTGVSSCAEN